MIFRDVILRTDKYVIKLMNIFYATDSIPPESRGGPGKRILSVCKEFARQGHDVFLVATVNDYASESTEQCGRLTIQKIYSHYNPALRPYRSLYNPPVIRELKRLICVRNPDVIHIDNIHQHISYAVLGVAKKYKIPTFITARDAMMFAYGKIYPKVKQCTNHDYRITWFENFRCARKSFNPLRNIIIRYYLRFAGKIFTNSFFLKDVLAQNGIYNTETIHNGIAFEIPELKEEFLRNKRAEFGLDNKKVVFLPGRLSFAKGIYALLDSMILVAREIPEAVVLGAGASSEERTRIYSYAKKLGIADRCVILEWISGKELEACYMLSDVVVSPSLCVDFFPGVNLEAAQYQKPVITGCFGGGKEFVLDGETGFVINPYNTKELAGRISTLLQDPRKASRFGVTGYKRLRESFTVAHQAEKLLGWYMRCSTSRAEKEVHPHESRDESGYKKSGNQSDKAKKF